MRCFVATWPAPDVLDALAELPRPQINGVRWTTADQWHVTLRFFGELDEAQLKLATGALAHAAASLHGPVEATGGPSSRFLGPGLVIWPVEGLADIARAVGQATVWTGQPLPDRRFVGHLTLARGHRGVDLRRARNLLAPLAMSWAISSLSLVRSQLQPEGALYSEVASFSLGR